MQAKSLHQDKKTCHDKWFIPWAPNVDHTIHLTKLFILRCEGIMGNIFYECCVYDSVDDRNLS